MSGGRPAVFLDRDGTLLEGLGYLADPAGVRLQPGAAEAVRLLHGEGLVTVVVTNQSGIARGLLDEARLGEIHARMESELAAGGGRIDGVYHCPHHPTEGRAPYVGPCDCRKPAPGMLLRAAAERGLDLARSYVVGDQIADLLAARRAGAVPVLVRTGWGGRPNDGAGSPLGEPIAAPGELPEDVRPAYVAQGALEAALWIVARERSRADGAGRAAR